MELLGPLPRLGGMLRQWAGSPKLDSHGPHPSLTVVGEFDQNLLPGWCKRWKPPEVSIIHAGDSGFWGGRSTNPTVGPRSGPSEAPGPLCTFPKVSPFSRPCASGVPGPTSKSLFLRRL